MSKPNQPSVTLEVSGYSHDGRGLATLDGKVAFVAGALDAEHVEAQITRKHTHYFDAQTVEVLQPSPDRVAPRCPHFGVCGGCSLQHLHEDKQVDIKQAALLDQLQRTAKVQPRSIMPPITGPKWGYRHKARLGVKYVHKKEKVLVGFREQSGRYLADLEICHVLHPSIGLKLTSLSELVAKLSIYRDIPQLEIAVGDEVTAIVVRHLKPLTEADLQTLIDFATQEQFHIYLQPKGPNTVHKLWPKDDNVRLHYQLDALSIAFHPNDFTQVNPEINRKMVAQALTYLDLQPNDTVLDLFCGLGNFSLPIAKRCQSVVGVEGSEEMVERGYENAKRNAIQNASFYCADLSQAEINADWVSRTYDKLLIDPPRSGALAILPHIATWQPRRLVYVSCNPATLARDTAELVSMGYVLQEAGVLDMFPHTRHVESIALFTKE